MMAERTPTASTNQQQKMSSAPTVSANSESSRASISKGAQAKRDQHKRRGDSEFRCSNYEQASKEYTLALSVDPNNPLILSNRSAAFMQMGQPQKALEDAKICILLDNKSARGYARLAAAHHALKQWEPAIEAYEKTLQKSPDNTVAQRDLKKCREQLAKQKSGGFAATATANNSNVNEQKVESEPKTKEKVKPEPEKADASKQHTASQITPIPEAEAVAATDSTLLSTNNDHKQAPKNLSPTRDDDDSLKPKPTVKTQAATSPAAVVTPESTPSTPSSTKVERQSVNSSLSEPKPASPGLQVKHLDSTPSTPSTEKDGRGVNSSFSTSTPVSPGISANTPATPITPVLASRRNTGLSELSKQLRLLQATNEAQNNEIDRLERQLRILAELKGISVDDLRRALHIACEDEAHAELRNQVAILRSRLEASTLASSKKSKDSFEKEATDKAMANMQLRVGELEEVAETLRGEIHELYQDLCEEKSKSTKLQHTCDQQKKKLDELTREALVVKENNEAQSQWSLSQQQLVVRGQTDSVDKEAHEAEVRQARLETQLERDRANLLEQQTHARENEVKLLNDQYKSRFQVQDQRIMDLEQQLSSLYAAFEMVEEEHEGVHERHRTLTSNLQEADEQVVRQLTKMESSPGLSATNDDPVVYATPVPTHAVATPEQTRSVVTETYSPSTHSLSSSHATPFPSPPLHHHRSFRNKKSPVKQNSIVALDSQHVISGWLLKRDKNILKGAWKKRYFILHGSNGNYQMSYSEKPKEKVKGTVGYITTGLSTVSPSIGFPKRPFVFVLRSNPQDLHAPVFHAAAEDCEEYDRWISALTLVTTGKDSTYSVGARSAQEQEAADHEVALRMQMEYMD